MSERLQWALMASLLCWCELTDVLRYTHTHTPTWGLRWNWTSKAGFSCVSNWQTSIVATRPSARTYTHTHHAHTTEEKGFSTLSWSVEGKAGLRSFCVSVMWTVSSSFRSAESCWVNPFYFFTLRLCSVSEACSCVCCSQHQRSRTSPPLPTDTAKGSTEQF